MSWDTRSIVIAVSVDNGGGELQRHGEELLAEFETRLQGLCEEPQYSSDAIRVVHCG